MIKKLAIIADDFTGANDAAVQFANHGLKTIVPLNLNDAETLIQSHDVVSYSTDTREVDAAQAYNRVKAAATALCGFGFEAFYKKVDSTLRGNIGAELDAVMDAVGLKLCLLAPAYPVYGRTIVGGDPLVNGLPLAQTYYGAEAPMPANETNALRLVEAQSKRRIGHLPLSTVMKGPAAVEEAVKTMAESGQEIIISDAVTDMDLRNAAQGFLSAEPGGLTSGSAGLAAELPRLLGLATHKPLLIISGSPNPVSVNQILEAQRALGAKLVEVDGRTALLGDDARGRAMAFLAEEVKRLLPLKTPLILATMHGENVAETYRKGSEQGLSKSKVGLNVAEILAKAAAEALENAEFNGLLLVGGVTTLQVLKALGARAVRVEGEAAAGIPIARLLGGRWEGLRVVTKAGGFGGPDSIITAVRRLGQLNTA